MSTLIQLKFSNPRPFGLGGQASDISVQRASSSNQPAAPDKVDVGRLKLEN
jgi:hypothetical protein